MVYQCLAGCLFFTNLIAEIESLCNLIGQLLHVVWDTDWNWNGTGMLLLLQIWNHPDIYYTEAMAQDLRRVSPVSDSLLLVIIHATILTQYRRN